MPSRAMLRALQATVLALGAPAGWFVIDTGRAWLGGPPANPDPLLYAYMGLGTVIVFAAFGWYLGWIEATLRRNVNRDALTGIYNRRYFDERLDEELAISRRNRKPLAVVQLDIDHFKRVNDTWGHAAGDRVLQMVATAIAASARPGDVVARVGGEEFAVILPACEEDEAVQIAERVRAAIASRELAHQGEMIQVRASAGVAGCRPWRDPGLTGGVLHNTADAAMYQAKQAGRDRVMRAAPALLAMAV